MKKITDLEKRVKMLECERDRGHLFISGVLIGSNVFTGQKIRINCGLCNYSATKSIADLNIAEKAAAIKLNLINLKGDN